jgi:glycosyltransferase involved in cell wall biosynthesis
MNETPQPLVSVVTPVFNMDSFMAECIESILVQTYTNFEYIIVNNCSTDGSLQIALDFAKKDSRIRIHNNEKFVPVIENHNIAFSLVSPFAKYCKVVSADDLIFPDCIMRMVELAEANPSVGIVGSYEIAGSRVRWQGFNYPISVISGRELCRQIFLGDDPAFGFGSPTSILYRADIVRNNGDFYPSPSPHSDTSACFKHLQYTDYGFVYQVLAYCRIHCGTQSSKSEDINRFASANLDDLIQYGCFFLNEEEMARVLKKLLNNYYQYLGLNLLLSRGTEFWDYHRKRLEELGHPITKYKLIKGLVIRSLREAVNMGQAIMKVRGWFASKSGRPIRDARRQIKAD